MTLVALAMSLIVLPVLLDMLGPRVLRSVWDRWRPGRERGRGWTRWAAFVAGRPRMLAVAGTAVLVLLSLPAVNLGSHVHAPETTQLPRPSMCVTPLRRRRARTARGRRAPSSS